MKSAVAAPLLTTPAASIGDRPLRQILDDAAGALRAVDQQVIGAGRVHGLLDGVAPPSHFGGRETRITRLEQRLEPRGQAGRREGAKGRHAGLYFGIFGTTRWNSFSFDPPAAWMVAVSAGPR